MRLLGKFDYNFTALAVEISKSFPKLSHLVSRGQCLVFRSNCFSIDTQTPMVLVMENLIKFPKLPHFTSLDVSPYKIKVASLNLQVVRR